jgi:hypothetical protein
MARVDKVQPCIFCGGVPCECPGTKAPARKKLAPKTERLAESVPPVQSPEGDDSWLPTETVSRFKKTEDSTPGLTEDDLILRDALRALEPILSANDKRKYHDVIHPQLRTETERKLVEWRQRNGKG